LPDLLPNILRRAYSDEVGSLALQHGKLSAGNKKTKIEITES
jgi:hypothetical protein